MAIDWRDSQRTRVDKSLCDHPLESGRCQEAAREILPVATEIDAGARTRLLRPKPGEGRFVVPKVKLGVRWYDHYSVNAQRHYVDALTGVDPARAGRDLLPYLPNTGDVVNAGTTNWCVAPAPTRGWAGLVFPDLDPDEAYDRLWREIAHVCRLDEDDPAEAWRSRAHTLETVAARLTERRFDAIRLHGPGTDLTVGLMPTSIWHAADFTTVDGLRHFPNIPSEEMFTTPDPARADGHVTATRPLEVYGAMIDGIRVEFADGKAVRIDADSGADTLRSIAAKDEGSSRLGELALVDGEGRIGPLGTIFYETLLDENAASHIALGNGYDLGVESAEDKARVNQSSVHVDFMIGSPELDVDGLTADGEAVPLLRGGAWQV